MWGVGASGSGHVSGAASPNDSITFHGTRTQTYQAADLPWHRHTYLIKVQQYIMKREPNRVPAGAYLVKGELADCSHDAIGDLAQPLLVLVGHLQAGGHTKYGV